MPGDSGRPRQNNIAPVSASPELVSSLKLGVAIDPMLVDKTAETARFLESCGYDSVWLSDETLVFNSPPDLIVPELFPALTAIAAATRKVNIGTAVIDASIRHPAKTAQGVVTVDSFSGGRLKVGIGGGEAGNRDPFGIPLDHPFERMEETVKIMKLLFRATYKEPVSFSGRFYSLKDAYLKIRPARAGGPPVIVSAFGPRALRLAGELGDGWLSFGHTPESFGKVLHGPVAAAARKAHRTLRGFETTLVIPIAVSKDKAKVNKVIAGIAKDWMVWSPDNMKLVVPDIEQPQVRQPYAKRNEPRAVKTLANLSRQIPDEIAMRTAVGGSAEDCVEQLEGFARAGLKQAILYIVAIDEPWKDSVRTISRKVLPGLRS